MSAKQRTPAEKAQRKAEKARRATAAASASAASGATAEDDDDDGDNGIIVSTATAAEAATEDAAAAESAEAAAAEASAESGSVSPSDSEGSDDDGDEQAEAAAQQRAMAAKLLMLEQTIAALVAEKAARELKRQAKRQAAAGSSAAPSTPLAIAVAHRSRVQSTPAAAALYGAGVRSPPPASSMGGVGSYHGSLAHLQPARVNPLHQHTKRLQPSELLGKEAAKGSVLEDWLFQIERAIGGDGQYALSDILGFAQTYWDRSVNTWWMGYTEMQQANGTPVRSWDGVKAAFRANYTAMSDEQTACDHLYSLSMKPSETMDEYVARVSELYNRIPRTRVNTEAAAEHMQRGVKPSRFPLAMVAVTTRQQSERLANAGKGLSFEVMRGLLIEAAVREPMYLIAAAPAAAASMPGQRPGGHSSQKQKINNMSTHGRYPQPEEDETRGEDGDGDEQSRQSVNAMDMKCYRCKGVGHVARDCKKPETRSCFICKAVGHLANRCPTKKGTGTGGAALPGNV
jgi:Retrotransposon gag protein/Zinc knuckle